MQIEEGVHMAEVTAFEICIVLYVILTCSYTEEDVLQNICLFLGIV